MRADADDQRGPLLGGEQHRDVLAGARRPAPTVKSRPSSRSRSEPGRAAVGIGVDDQLRPGPQRLLAGRVHVAEDEVGLVALLDDRVRRRRRRRSAPAARRGCRRRSARRSFGWSVPRTTISACRSRKTVRVSGKSIVPESSSPSSRMWDIVFSVKSCSAWSIRRRCSSSSRASSSTSSRRPSATTSPADPDRRPRRAPRSPSRERSNSAGPFTSISGTPARTRVSGPAFGIAAVRRGRDVDDRPHAARRPAPRPRSGRGCGGRSRRRPAEPRRLTRSLVRCPGARCRGPARAGCGRCAPAEKRAQAAAAGGRHRPDYGSFASPARAGRPGA